MVFHCSLGHQNFNPRSHKGSDLFFLIAQGCAFHFNPRSHKGSDAIPRHTNASHYRISIHAPTRGATGAAYLSAHGGLISIHAPTRGATINKYVLVNVLRQFQSTLPQGERLNAEQVSATVNDFNPRSHKGSDEYST